METRTDTASVTKTGRAAPPGAPLLAILYNPAAYMRAAQQKLPLSHSLGAIAVACFFQILSVLVMRSPSVQFSSFALTAGLFVDIAGRATLLLFAAIMTHFFASSISGAAKGWKLFSLVLVCQLPLLFTLPAAFLARGIASGSWLLYFFFAALLVVWSLVLMVMAIKETYTVTTPQAVGVFIFPAVFLAAGSVILLWTFIFRLMLALS
jgi:hypothetical protein